MKVKITRKEAGGGFPKFFHGPKRFLIDVDVEFTPEERGAIDTAGLYNRKLADVPSLNVQTYHYGLEPFYVKHLVEKKGWIEFPDRASANTFEDDLRERILPGLKALIAGGKRRPDEDTFEL